jgi:hypothetical protein
LRTLLFSSVITDIASPLLVDDSIISLIMNYVNAPLERFELPT